MIEKYLDAEFEVIKGSAIATKGRIIKLLSSNKIDLNTFTPISRISSISV